MSKNRWAATFLALAVVLAGFSFVGGVAMAPTITDKDPRAKPVGAVDVGFSQDMMVHHEQAVFMARLAETETSRDVQAFARQIESSQTREIGQMVGLLDAWGKQVVPNGPPMGWMHETRSSHSDMGDAHESTASDEPAGMPGMATQSELDELANASGQAKDVLFLQLMLRHHEGATQMLQYAQGQASTEAVRVLASRMSFDQRQESQLMAQMLQGRGAQPLSLGEE